MTPEAMKMWLRDRARLDGLPCLAILRHIEQLEAEIAQLRAGPPRDWIQSVYTPPMVFPSVPEIVSPHQ